jgi:O-antigen/teichoic acid export membrane protein
MSDRRANGSGPFAGVLSGLVRGLGTPGFVRDVAETYATRVALVGIGLVTSVVVARILGPTGRGFYAVAMTVGGVGVQIGNLGLQAANTYSVARDASRLSALLGNSLLVSFGFGTVVAAAVWSAFCVWPSAAPVEGGLLLLSLAWIPVGLAYLLLQNLLIGIGDVRSFNSAEIGNRVLSVLLVGVVVLLGAVRPETVFLAALAALAVAVAWMLRRLCVRFGARLALSVPLFRENVRYGLKAYAAAMFAFVVLRSDLLLVQYLLGPEQVGYYSIAVTIADQLYMLPVVVGTILFPRLSGMPGDAERWAYARRVSLWVGAGMTAFAVVVGLAAGPLIRLLFGASFLPAVPALLWLLPGIVMLSVNTIYMNYFASTGMPPVTILAPAAAALFNVGLNLALIPRLGIVGASISSVAAYGGMLAASSIYLRYAKGRSGP